ncbi:MAG: ABC transporter permease [Candidatus Nanopelagicales bacterium]
MLRATLRALFAYKVRLALSALSIVLGVAFVAGTFIFTDSLKQAFSDLTKAGQSDLVVRPQQAFQTRMSADTTVRTLPTSLVGTIAALPGTAEAAGFVQVRNVTVLGPDGKPVGQQMGPGSVGMGESWTTAASLQQWKLAEGSAPAAPDQVVVDQTTAEKAGLKVGSPVDLLLPNGTAQKPTISGIAEATLATLGSGGSTVLWDLATAESLLTKPGEVTSIRVTAKPGVSQTDLQQQVMAILPPDVMTQTGEQATSDLSRSLNERLGFLNTFLLVFGLIALFVSAFLIYNTFSILVAQRTRELALMRAIGATRRQVRTSVLVEALIVALVAATVGLLVGIGVSQGLRALFAALGAPLPGTGLVLLPRTFAVAYGIGLVVTLVSALIPAQRAATIAPVAAMRADATPVAKSLRRRGIVGTVLLLVAIGFGAWALSIPGGGTKAAQLLGASALAAIFAALALAPIAARVLVPVIGLPFRRSTVGRLAIENARRNPRRTAATAGALMIGLALISALSVLASSTIKSTDAVVDKVIGADFVVMGSSFQPFPTTIAGQIAAIPGVAVSTPVKSAVARAPGSTSADGGVTIITLVDPAKIQEVLTFDLTEGDLNALNTPGTVIVDTKTSQQTGFGLGATPTITPLTGPVPMTIVGIYEPAGFFTGWAAGMASDKVLGAPDQDSAVYVKAAPGADKAAVRDSIEQVLKAYPIVTLSDQSEFKAQIRDQINQLLAFIVALLILAVLIAFLGIVNTLALSVFERTREIGLLRAVGTTRSQIRRMILIESVLIAVLGSALGMFIGVLYGIGLQRVLAEQGISELGISAGQLLFFLAISAVGGVVAALWPAFRASRLNVLRAIATD